MAELRRRIANFIYPEGAHLRPRFDGDDFARGWNACVKLWNETAHERWTRERVADRGLSRKLAAEQEQNHAR